MFFSEALILETTYSSTADNRDGTVEYFLFLKAKVSWLISERDFVGYKECCIIM